MVVVMVIVMVMVMVMVMALAMVLVLVLVLVMVMVIVMVIVMVMVMVMAVNAIVTCRPFSGSEPRYLSNEPTIKIDCMSTSHMYYISVRKPKGSINT
jgi:uncharacterized membrane protein YqiK